MKNYIQLLCQINLPQRQTTQMIFDNNTNENKNNIKKHGDPY